MKIRESDRTGFTDQRIFYAPLGHSWTFPSPGFVVIVMIHGGVKESSSNKIDTLNILVYMYVCIYLFLDSTSIGPHCVRSMVWFHRFIAWDINYDNNS